MAELAPRFCMPACCLYNARQPQTLRQNPPNNQAVTWSNGRTYITIPSVREILVLKTVSIGAELLRRNEDGFWPSPPLSIGAGELRLESIDFSIPLAAAYRTTRLAPEK